MSGKAIAAAILLCCAALLGHMARAAGCEEDVITQHMVGEALLAAHLVAAVEKGGMPPARINALLKEVAEKSAIDEFWITNSSGHAYLTNTGVDFTFSPDPAKQPQASDFWPLLEGKKDTVVQQARKREIDDQVFKMSESRVSTSRASCRSASPQNTCPAAADRARVKDEERGSGHCSDRKCKNGGGSNRPRRGTIEGGDACV